MKLEINNCRECPFANFDSDWGWDSCNLEKKLGGSLRPIESAPWEELPADKRHKHCPLEKDIFIEIKLN